MLYYFLTFFCGKKVNLSYLQSKKLKGDILKKKNDVFYELVNVMNKLRDKDGCPWDREQTRDSIKPYLIEEAYELLEAIDEKNPDKIKEELGDLLFQIIFHAKLAEEQNEFDIFDVCRHIKEKMIRRHPHVFGDIEVSCSKEVLEQWEDIKRKEPKNSGRKSALDGIPEKLPSLLRAHRFQEKAARVGFDWEKLEDVFGKVEEELTELKQTFSKKNKVEMEHELGDVLFSLVNIARFIKVNPEESMRKAIGRFTERFKYIEEETAKKGLDLKNLSLQEMDKYWNEAKIFYRR